MGIRISSSDLRLKPGSNRMGPTELSLSSPGNRLQLGSPRISLSSNRDKTLSSRMGLGRLGMELTPIRMEQVSISLNRLLEGFKLGLRIKLRPIRIKLVLIRIQPILCHFSLVPTSLSLSTLACRLGCLACIPFFGILPVSISIVT